MVCHPPQLLDYSQHRNDLGKIEYMQTVLILLRRMHHMQE